MPDIVQGNRRIYYESRGQGPALILIRGLGSNADHWYAQVPALARHYQVITFDNRGVARSSDPGGPLSIRAMAEDTVGLLDALHISQAHVVGLSMGGMIAQEIAIRHSPRVKGLVLAVTHCGGKHQVKAAQEVTEAFQRLVDIGSEEAKMKAFSFFFAPATIRERLQVVQDYVAVSMRNPVGMDILKRQWDAVREHDAYDRLNRIKALTLVLTGAQDMLVPPANATILTERIPRSELLVIPDGGHQVLIEQPEACNRALIAFLQKVDALPLEKKRHLTGSRAVQH
jgi:3-oxoadipate enol-lactonase